MKRCIHEYQTKTKRSVSTADGKSYVEEILKAVKIEADILTFINKSNCRISKPIYSKSLINAITQMYEVLNIT
jgi:hypothetical protein